MTSSEARLTPTALVWCALIILASLILGVGIADNPMQISLLVLGVGWLVLLPYHATLSVYLSVATFASALIIPFFPGRPFFWEFAALLGWSGLVVTFSLRRYAPDFGTTIKQNRWLFVGLTGYCVVLMVTMVTRGFGLRILGTQLMGGRYYFQQLSCAIFPLLFVACRLEEKTLVRLFRLQCLLTVTYLVSDLVFSFGSSKLFVLLQFIELPGDALNFEIQSTEFGLRRFQSLGIVGQWLIFGLLTRYRLRDFLSVRAVFLLPLTLGILGVGLMSGHRWVPLIVGLTLVFCAIAQRFLTPKNTLITLFLAAGTLFATYAYAREMPLAIQRAVSFLPGINIDSKSFADASATIETRRQLRSIGWNMIPEYFWLGRGFMQPATADYSVRWDPTWITWHVNQGKFYNGPIGLMVNTGIFGALFMLLFLGAGTLLALRVMRRLRRMPCNDAFTSVCSLITGLWMANVVAYLVLHGDSEYAMKTFALQAGLLMVCDHHLQQRLQPQPAAP